MKLTVERTKVTRFSRQAKAREAETEPVKRYYERKKEIIYCHKLDMHTHQCNEVGT